MTALPNVRGMTIREACRSLAAAFREAGIDSPELDARLIVAAALGISHEAIIARAGDTLTLEQGRRVDDMRQRRLMREPVSRMLGARDFWGRSFALNEATLDPRPDSEALIETALAVVNAEGWRQSPLRILDLGTGSGCLLLSLLAELPHATGIGTDVAALALDAARANALRLGLAGRAAFAMADWLDGIEGPFDIVISNPPYIPSPMLADLQPEVRFDPACALDGGESGLEAYRRIIPALAHVLPGPGWAIFEIGPGQAESVLKLMRGAGFDSCPPVPPVYRDLAGRERGVAVKRQG